MNLNSFLFVGLCLCLFPLNICAQVIHIEGNYIMIDCSDMPASMRRVDTYTNGKIPTHTDLDDWSKLPFKSFAISQVENASSLGFIKAIDLCNAYGGPKGGEQGKWRLPTYNELVLMWVYRVKLEEHPGFTPFYNSWYWSCTEYGSIASPSARATVFDTGYTTPILKSRNIHVRCVREF